jgi:hypothetical protein
MEKALDPDVLLSDFSEDDTAWVLRDLKSGEYVVIPHEKYPGRIILHFFMSAADATRVREELDRANPAFSSKEIYPYEVKLKAAARSSVADDPVNGFVVHTPREVLEFIEHRH